MEADHIVVERAKNGDIRAFSELVLRHQKSLLRLAYRVLGDLEMAQDVVQESLMKAYQKLDSFEGRSAFKSWVYQITLNTAKNKLRGKRPELVDVEKTNIVYDFDFEDEILNQDLKIIVRAEVDKLPLKQRTALNLRIFEDMSFAEIAEVMHCPYDTAKANYRHALMKLRHTLGDQVSLKAFLPDNINEQLEAEA
ncbi:MAG: sigma-70 family RNA polymerase sigma factor [Bdellovibrionales bacterium]|nr:sigma-70 family RNA polymerase sigma factor [Bdellovibrionales bacterium]